MIARDTAARIWNCYREIESAEKLLKDMADGFDKWQEDKHAPTLKDAFGRRRQLQLGIPTGENGHRLFDVAPELAQSVVRAHVAKKHAELVEVNEQARIELDNANSSADSAG